MKEKYYRDPLITPLWRFLSPFDQHLCDQLQQKSLLLKILLFCFKEEAAI